LWFDVIGAINEIPQIGFPCIRVDGRWQDDVTARPLDINPGANVGLIDDASWRLGKEIMPPATSGMTEYRMWQRTMLPL
jgi:hypothetical protein